MKTSAIALAACASVAAANPYTLLATHSASPIHLQPIHANGQAFWIGKKTGYYCPSGAGIDCKDFSNQTTVGYGSGSFSMAVEVAGGQQGWIDPKTGQVGYTQAHSASQPAGAIVSGWKVTHGESFDSVSWKNGVVFCSQSKSAKNGPWKMYAQVKGVKFGDNCLGAGIIASNATIGAWQYN